MEDTTRKLPQDIKDTSKVAKEDFGQGLVYQKNSYEETVYSIPVDTNSAQRRMHHKRRFRK